MNRELKRYDWISCWREGVEVCGIVVMTESDDGVRPAKAYWFDIKAWGEISEFKLLTKEYAYELETGKVLYEVFDPYHKDDDPIGDEFIWAERYKGQTSGWSADMDGLDRNDARRCIGVPFDDFANQQRKNFQPVEPPMCPICDQGLVSSISHGCPLCGYVSEDVVEIALEKGFNVLLGMRRGNKVSAQELEKAVEAMSKAIREKGSSHLKVCFGIYENSQTSAQEK